MDHSAVAQDRDHICDREHLPEGVRNIDDRASGIAQAPDEGEQLGRLTLT